MPAGPTTDIVAPAAAPNGLTIVPSDLAARQLRRSFDRQQRSEGHTVWQPASVLSWGQWMRSLWTESIVNGAEDRLLLNAAQEHSLWREIVQSGKAPETLTSPDALATLAATAYALAASHGALSQLKASATTHDARIFAVWAEDFTRLCQREGYLSQSQLPSALAMQIASGGIQAPASVHLNGFLQRVPEQERFLAALRKAGTVLTMDKPSAKPIAFPIHSLIEAPSEKEELRTVAAWLRDFLHTGQAAGRNPHLALVLPEVDRERAALESVLRKALAPELQLVGSNETAAPYEFVTGGSLAEHSMVATALDLARWAIHPQERERVSALILSPYLGEADTIAARGRFDAQALRRAHLLHPEVSIEAILRLARHSDFGPATLRWLAPFQAFVANSGNFQPARGYAGWTEFLRRLLSAAGWPGNTLSPGDATALQAWEHALDTVATLDFSGQRVSFSETISALSRQVATTPLRTARGDASVLVLRPADVPGMSFDAVVFARATDANWPTAERANPLLDWKLQASLTMPGANRNAGAAHARALTETILRSASQGLVTWSANTAEGKQRPSPLLTNFSLQPLPAQDTLPTLPAEEHLAAESFVDDAPLPPLPATLVHGGAAVLQHQAACGFRAFAKIRLRSNAPEALDAGLNSSARGNLLHDVMQSFWTAAESQTNLRNMPEADRKALLHRCIEDTLRKGYAAGSDWDSAYLRVQHTRLFRLLEKWLEQELKRGPFSVVASEKSTEVSVGPIDLKVRIDRIDRIEEAGDLEDGFLLVDYKTGFSASPADWHGERPDEPQVPLYALLPEAGTLAGVAFAKVRAGKDMKWMGYAGRDGVLPGRDTVREIGDLTGEWRVHLEALAQAFADGDTAVRPKEYPVTCKHCGQNLLCRLDSAALLAADDDSPTDEYSSEAAH